MRHGRVKKGDKIPVKSTGKVHLVDSVGVFTPKHTQTADLKAGEVGFIIASIKDIHGAPVGDTLTLSSTPEVEVLPGFKRSSRRFMPACSRSAPTILKISAMHCRS